MILRGKIVHGPMRGEGLVEHFYYRIIHTLGFEPYKGTLDVKIDKHIDLEPYATKVLDHILLDGTRMIDAYLCPVTIRKDGKEEKAWAMQKHKDVHSRGILEILSKDRLKDKLELKEGDMVEIDFPHEKTKKSARRRELALRFRRKKQDIRNIMSGDTTLMKR
ncbi:MAG: DUF120 domain-containing protein [Candidatus Aenigmarchaeota archaeon]|nr:DUF120 domain-containing protein [Candidatus Aenigmarchaeota archaeon]MDI6722517.1 DUF120 domain-containing protein [Candidatus Aenigmarchaeota archaeon]